MSFLKDFPGIPTQVAIILAFVVVYICKRVISRFHKKTAIQNENSLRPCIALFRDEVTGQLYPKNIGHGPAFNVYFNPIEAGPYKYEFPKYDLLGQGDYSSDFHVVKMKNAPSYEIIPEQIDLFEIKNDFALKISYSNIEKVRYESVLRVSRANHTIELVRSGRIC